MRAISQVAPQGTGTSNVIIVDKDILQTGSIGVAVEIPSGTLTAQVEWSLDDPFAVYASSYSANATWFVDKNLIALSASKAAPPVCSAGFVIPVRALRLRNTAWTSGTSTIVVVQTGGIS